MTILLGCHNLIYLICCWLHYISIRYNHFLLWIGIQLPNSDPSWWLPYALAPNKSNLTLQMTIVNPKCIQSTSNWSFCTQTGMAKCKTCESTRNRARKVMARDWSPLTVAAVCCATVWVQQSHLLTSSLPPRRTVLNIKLRKGRWKRTTMSLSTTMNLQHLHKRHTLRRRWASHPRRLAPLAPPLQPAALPPHTPHPRLQCPQRWPQ